MDPRIILFAKQLADNLYPANEFYKYSYDESELADETYTVRRSNAGAKPTGVTNPSSFPLAVSGRVDEVEDYVLDTHATLPTLLRWDEDMEVSYSKRESILKNHRDVLVTLIADGMLDNWMNGFLAASAVRTTGAATGVLAHATATGTRKAITKADIIDLVTLIAEMDVPIDDGKLYALVPSRMYGEMLKVDDFVDYQKRGMVDLIGKGFFGEIMGVKFKTRSKGARFSNAGTPAYKAINSAAAAADNLAIIAWHADYVARAETAPKVLIDENNPVWTGTIMNAVARSGGKPFRKDRKGIVALVQAHG